MKRLPVYDQGTECGTLEIERDGLYLRFGARVYDLPGTGIARLAALGGGMRAELGVLTPEGEGYVAARRLPARQFPGTFTHGVIEREETAWRPFSGRICGVYVQEGLVRRCRGAEERALPFDPALCGALTPYLSGLSTMMRAGRLWLVFRRAGT